MVNYFNVLSHDDEDEENGLEEQQTATALKTTTTPPNTSGSSEGIVIPSVYNGFQIKEKSNIQQHFEVQFDFNEHNQELSFTDSWVLWYDTKKEKSSTPDENSEYLQNIQKLGSFNNLKDFKALWEGINKPLDVNGNISIFKEGIEPAWEDNKNKDGGKYSVNYARDGHGDFSRVLNAWFTLITSIVYSSWEHYNQTNGVVLSIRNWGASINLWNDNSDNVQVQSLKESFQNIIRVKFCKFSSHKQSISKSKDDKHSDANNGINGLGNITKKKKIYNANLNQLNMMNGYLNKNYNENSNSNNSKDLNGANQWTISGIPKKKKEISNSDESNTIVKKESLLSVRPNHLPVQLQSNITPVLNSSNSSTPIVNTESISPVIVPEIPKGVNAWSTGLLLGNPKSPESESTEPEQQLEQISINSNSNNNNNNTNNIENTIVEEKQTSPQTNGIKPSIPDGVNAWSTGLLLPKPVVQETLVQEPVVEKELPKESQKSDSAWGSNKLISKSKKEANIPRNSSKDNLEKLNNNSNNNSGLFWEDSDVKPQQSVKPIKEKKEKVEKIEKKEKVIKEEKKDKFNKEEKNKYNNKVSSNKAPVSLWNNSQNLIQLISTQPEPVEQPEEIKEQQQSPTIESEKVVKLEIKESKKTVDTVTTEVVKKQEVEWTKIEEKKPKKPKTQVESNNTSTTSNIKSNEPKDKTLFRNLLVEEPTAYPSPIKATPPTKEVSTVSQVNKKSKESKEKDTKKPKESKDTKDSKKSITSTKPNTATTTTTKQTQPKQSQQSLSPNLIMVLVLVFLIILYFLLF